MGAMKERTVYDKTCRTMINFDCKAEEYGSFSQGGSSSDGYGSSGSDGYGSSGYESSDSGYGGSSSAPQYKCKRTPETKCYTTPRTVSSDYCEERDEEVCEKLTVRVPVPQEKQVCHDEKKKVCELEQRSQPKQVKNTSIPNNADPFPKLCATMLIRCHWYQAVYHHPVRNVAIILKSVARMYQSNTAIKFRIK